jgi:hypothetical protein
MPVDFFSSQHIDIMTLQINSAKYQLYNVPIHFTQFIPCGGFKPTIFSS